MLLTLNNQVSSIEYSDNSVEQKIILPKVLTQTTAHPSRSEKYSLVKTSDVIDQFSNSKFVYVENSFREEKNRKPEYKGFGTHLLAFEHPELTKSLGEFNHEVTPRLYLRNSYHGRTKLLINLGLFRGACLNGLFFGTSFQSIPLKHIGISQTDVEAVLEMMITAYKNDVVPFLTTLKGTILNRQAQVEFAEAVMRERLKLNKGTILKMDSEKLLTVLRADDIEDNAWNVLNRVQENLGLNFRSTQVNISYTYEGKDKDDNVIQKERKVSRISGIQNVINLNQFVFDKMVELLPKKNEEVKVAA